MSKRTIFYQKHVEAGAKMIDFGGFLMPVQYSGIKQEHQAVREAAGLFDVSHMGEFFVSGDAALELVQRITINDASKLVPGKAQYSAMCYEDGGLVDDLIVYMLAEGEYLLVVNASNIEKDLAWILEQKRGLERVDAGGAGDLDVKVEDRSAEMALLALQGPKSTAILKNCTALSEADLAAIPFYGFMIGEVAGQPGVIISATGYTGEKGFELYIDTTAADPLVIWDALMAAGESEGLMPAGLGARDTLRLEMGYALYGNDIDKDTHPLESRMGWLTKLENGYFVGRDALLAIREQGVARGLTGFVMEDERRVPRQGYAVYAGAGGGEADENGADAGNGTGAGKQIGVVTSGGLSVSTGRGIGMARLQKAYTAEGTPVLIEIRGKMFAATCKKPPFVKT